MPLLMSKEINTMEQRQLSMCGNPKYNSLMNLVCLSYGYWEVHLVKISTVLKLVGRYFFKNHILIPIHVVSFLEQFFHFCLTTLN